MGASTRGVQPFVSGLQRSHPEVHNLDIAVAVHKDILRLQISMANTEAMNIGKTSNQLPEYTNSFWLRKSAVGGDVVEKLTAFHVL